MGKEYRVGFILFLALALRIAEAKHSFVGGIQPISVENSRVKEADETIMKKINQEHQGERVLVLVEIEDAKYQVGPKFKYFLCFEVGESHCLKHNNGTLVEPRISHLKYTEDTRFYQSNVGIKLRRKCKSHNSQKCKPDRSRKCKLDKSRPRKACGARISVAPWNGTPKIHYRC